MLRQTHTYVVMELSEGAYEEIKQKMLAAGYGHVFHTDSQHGEVIDMHGIAVGLDKEDSGEQISTQPR